MSVENKNKNICVMGKRNIDIFDVVLAAKQFGRKWSKYDGGERAGYQKFWVSLFRDVFGVEDAADEIEFEKSVNLDATRGAIDGYIASTNVLIEHKAPGKSLNKAHLQAENYSKSLENAASKIVTCNFGMISIYTPQMEALTFPITMLADHLQDVADLIGLVLPSF